MLEPFNGLPFLEFNAAETSRSVSRSHCESILSYLWRHRNAFGSRHEPWLVYACHFAVSTLLFKLSLPGPHEGTAIQGCELLFDMGLYIPQANNMLLALSEEARSRGIEVPGPCKKFLGAGVTAIGRVSIANVTPLVYSGSGTAPDRPCQAIFSRRIESLEESEGKFSNDIIQSPERQ